MYVHATVPRETQNALLSRGTNRNKQALPIAYLFPRKDLVRDTLEDEFQARPVTRRVVLHGHVSLWWPIITWSGLRDVPRRLRGDTGYNWRKISNLCTKMNVRFPHMGMNVSKHQLQMLQVRPCSHRTRSHYVSRYRTQTILCSDSTHNNMHKHLRHDVIMGISSVSLCKMVNNVPVQYDEFSFADDIGNNPCMYDIENENYHSRDTPCRNLQTNWGEAWNFR